MARKRSTVSVVIVVAPVVVAPGQVTGRSWWSVGLGVVFVALQVDAAEAVLQ